MFPATYRSRRAALLADTPEEIVNQYSHTPSPLYGLLLVAVVWAAVGTG